MIVPRLRPADQGLILVAVGAIGFGLRPLFARWALVDGIGPPLAALLTLAPTALLCLPLTLGFLRREIAFAKRRAEASWALVAGVFVAAGSLAYLRALEALPVATPTVIYFAYPLFVVGATLVLLPAIGRAGLAALGGLGATGWVGAAGLVVLCGFVPQLTTTLGVPRAGADRAAIAGGLELITALAVGWLALGEPVAAREVMGVLAIAAAVLLAGRARA